ncbi:f-box domain-containing protein [Diplodia corticola]|uniref:F-box domain-containing protein n=1 Tax=Diplodia corticola TaxID=236234 RepID=A0A1J9S4E2_9PEZI|nr:f-box domain-containing protein [Diplodia corticola]OJD34844.1 f-box domain-containing protein [Diplodia corticola]
MPSLLELSNEILHEILLLVDPGDLACLAQCCRSLRTFINDSELLWKDFYLRNFDDPRLQRQDVKFSWQADFSRMWKLNLLLSSESVESKKANFPFISSAVDDLVALSSSCSQSSATARFLRRHFGESSTTNRAAILSGSSLYHRAGSEVQKPFDDECDRQMSAKLAVLHGVPMELSDRRQTKPVHSYARSRVYDLRRYTDETLWGPFMDDGSQRVDWENLESLLIVLSWNINRFCERAYGRFRPLWNVPFTGVPTNSFRSKAPYRFADDPSDDDSGMLEAMHMITPATSTDAPNFQRVDSPLNNTHSLLDEQDPYGVTGTWARIVCFLDYTELYHFNFEGHPIPDNQPREPITTPEAIRFITLNLRVRRIEAPGPGDGQELPIVHFVGTSRSMHSSWDPNANSKIRGTVRQTPEGYVRWTSFSIFHGEERWRSECVQIGGLRSARGMLGTWFDKDNNPEGPAGPTAFWKISDSLMKGAGHPPLLPLT